MNVSGISAANIIVAALVLVLLMRSQLRARPLKERSRVGLVLMIVGVFETYSFISQQDPPGGDLGIVVFSLGIGVGLAALRACTIRLWRQDGQIYQKGNALTAALWIISLVLHLAIDALAESRIGSVSILLYFGIVIFVQRQVVLTRARTKSLIGPGAGVTP